MSVQRYATMKDSGVAYLGRIPSHWQVKPMRRLVCPVTEKASRREYAVALDNIEGWTGRHIEPQIAPDYSGEGVGFRQGDILFGKLRPYLAKAWIAERNGEAVGDFHVLRTNKGVLPGLFQKQLLTKEVIGIINGSTYGAKMPRASWEFMASIAMVQPPTTEQASICAFLVRETAKIDALIAEQEQLLLLLEEKRQALILRTVTRGLNPKVPMKDSGMEWLGQVPMHWKMAALKRYALVERGRFSHRPRNDPTLYDGPYPFLQTGDVAAAADSGLVTSFTQTLNEKGLAQSRLFPSGTIVMGIAASVAQVAVTTFDSCFPDSVVGIQNRKGLLSSYIVWLFRASAKELTSLAVENTQLNLNVERLGALRVALPPTTEQSEIVDYLQQAATYFQVLTQECEINKRHLFERRAALISAAVTGKIDVRSVSPVVELPQAAE